MQQHSWLYSDSFLKRAFAIWGHYMVANLIIGGCVMAFMFAMALAFGLSLAPYSTSVSDDGPSPTIDFEAIVD